MLESGNNGNRKRTPQDEICIEPFRKKKTNHVNVLSEEMNFV